VRSARRSPLPMRSSGGPGGANCSASYVPLDAQALEAAVVGLSEVLIQQIPDLHRSYSLTRSLENDLHAAALVREGQVG
jgi:hypothetical protein